MTAKRVVGVVAAAILAAPVARATAADTVLWVNGTESIVPVKSSGTAPSSPPALLHGAFGSDPVITVPYPASFWPLTAVADPTGPTLGTSVRIGTAALGTAIRTAGSLRTAWRPWPLTARPSTRSSPCRCCSTATAASSNGLTGWDRRRA